MHIALILMVAFANILKVDSPSESIICNHLFFFTNFSSATQWSSYLSSVNFKLVIPYCTYSIPFAQRYHMSRAFASNIW
jgi:hypothetical protein